MAKKLPTKIVRDIADHAKRVEAFHKKAKPGTITAKNKANLSILKQTAEAAKRGDLSALKTLLDQHSQPKGSQVSGWRDAVDKAHGGTNKSKGPAQRLAENTPKEKRPLVRRPYGATEKSAATKALPGNQFDSDAFFDAKMAEGKKERSHAQKATGVPSSSRSAEARLASEKANAHAERIEAKKHELAGNFERADAAKKRARYHQDNVDALSGSGFKENTPKERMSRQQSAANLAHSEVRKAKEALAKGDHKTAQAYVDSAKKSASFASPDNHAVRDAIHEVAVPVQAAVLGRKPLSYSEQAQKDREREKKWREADAAQDKKWAAAAAKNKSRAERYMGDKEEGRKKVAKKEKTPRVLKTGKHGGQYYVNDAGKKVYVGKKAKGKKAKAK